MILTCFKSLRALLTWIVQYLHISSLKKCHALSNWLLIIARQPFSGLTLDFEADLSRKYAFFLPFNLILTFLVLGFGLAYSLRYFVWIDKEVFIWILSCLLTNTSQWTSVNLWEDQLISLWENDFGRWPIIISVNLINFVTGVCFHLNDFLTHKSINSCEARDVYENNFFQPPWSENDSPLRTGTYDINTGTKPKILICFKQSI